MRLARTPPIMPQVLTGVLQVANVLMHVATVIAEIPLVVLEVAAITVVILAIVPQVALVAADSRAVARDSACPVRRRTHCPASGPDEAEPRPGAGRGDRRSDFSCPGRCRGRRGRDPGDPCGFCLVGLDVAAILVDGSRSLSMRVGPAFDPRPKPAGPPHARRWRSGSQRQPSKLMATVKVNLCCLPNMDAPLCGKGAGQTARGNAPEALTANRIMPRLPSWHTGSACTGEKRGSCEFRGSREGERNEGGLNEGSGPLPRIEAFDARLVPNSYLSNPPDAGRYRENRSLIIAHDGDDCERIGMKK